MSVNSMSVNSMSVNSMSVNAVLLFPLLGLLGMVQCDINASDIVDNAYPLRIDTFFMTDDEVEQRNAEMANTRYHMACCDTYFKYTVLESVVDLNGTTVNMATMNGVHQQVTTQTCKKVSNCDLCGCEMVERVFGAIVFKPSNPDRNYLSYVKAPIQCMCLNNANINFNDGSFAFANISGNNNSRSKCQNNGQEDVSGFLSLIICIMFCHLVWGGIA